MLACPGRMERAGDVIHVIADRLDDLSDLLRNVGKRNVGLSIGPERGDGTRHGIEPDKRKGCGLGNRGPRDIDILNLRPGGGIKVPTRDFR